MAEGQADLTIQEVPQALRVLQVLQVPRALRVLQVPRALQVLQANQVAQSQARILDQIPDKVQACFKNYSADPLHCKCMKSLYKPVGGNCRRQVDFVFARFADILRSDKG